MDTFVLTSCKVPGVVPVWNDGGVAKSYLRMTADEGWLVFGKVTSGRARGKSRLEKLFAEKIFNSSDLRLFGIGSYFGSTCHRVLRRCNFSGGSEILWRFKLGFRSDAEFRRESFDWI